MRFNRAEEIILLKEVVAHQVHVAAFAPMHKKFDLTTGAMTENPILRFNVKGCTVQMNFKSASDLQKVESERLQEAGQRRWDHLGRQASGQPVGGKGGGAWGKCEQKIE